MAVAAASASVSNTTTADAVTGAQAQDSKSKSKTNFADVLSSLLSGPSVQQQTVQDNISKHNLAAFSQAKAAINASTVADGDSADDAPDATTALATKMSGTAVAGTAAQTAQSNTGAKQALTSATQAKLVSALAQAANTHAKIVGSDGQTATSSDSNGTQAQNETPAETAAVLAAMQSAQPVVTTVAANADKTAATITPRSMTQLEKAALGNTAQQTLHSATPSAKTEAQALTIPADTKSANGGDAQTGSGQKQSHESDSARIAADADRSSNTPSQQTSVPDAPQPTANPAPALQTAANTAVTSAASAIGNSAAQTTTAPTTIATTLQVAQQTTTSTATPDLAALAVSIAAKSKDGQNEFNIRMDPAELGRVDVRLSVDAAGKAQAHLTADKPQTLALLQRDSQTLERSLKDSGLDLSNNGLNFSLKGEQQSSTPTFVARNRALSIASVQTTDTVSSSSGTSTAPGDSRLDIRV